MNLNPTVLVASDDSFKLSTLSAALRLHSINVVAEARTSEIAENLHKHLSPEVVVIDMQFTDNKSIALVSKFRKINPSLGIVLLTACADLRLIGFKEIEIPEGAQVLLKKSISDLGVLNNAIIRSIAAVDSHEKMSWVDGLGALHDEGSKTILDEFTDIQISTFRLLSQGFSNSEIAKLRFVSEKSVEQIVARIARHLRISPDRTHNMRVVLTGEYFNLIGSPRH